MTAETLARIEAGEIRGERLLLRPPRMSDSGPLSLYAGDERVAKMTAMIPHPYPPGAAEAFIAAATSGRSPEAIWVIDATPDEGAELVGVIGVKHESAELGYWIGPPFWGTGYASEAAAMVCRHLVGECGLDRITASVFFDNPASQKVLLRTGFRQVGETWIHSIGRQIDVPAITYELTEAPA